MNAPRVLARSVAIAAAMGALVPTVVAAVADRVVPTERIVPADASAPMCLVVARWRAEAFGRVAAGRAAWVTAPDGSVRIDLALDDDRPGSPDAAGDPLRQQGHGWTLVAGPGGDGVYGAWDREWAVAPVGLTALVRQVVAPAAAPSRPRAVVLEFDPAESVDGAPAPADLRRQLVQRGRGGGGPGERLTVRHDRQAGVCRVRSSRRPGALELRPEPARGVSGAVAEVFLPWWPLAEVITPVPDGAEPGTSGPNGR